MELLAHPYLDEFYGGEHLDRARRTHLEGIIRFLPWCATIDAFQHWLYTNPGHSRAERTDAWRALVARFGNEVAWDGLDAAGHPLAPGTYFVSMSLDGRALGPGAKAVLLR